MASGVGGPRFNLRIEILFIDRQLQAGGIYNAKIVSISELRFFSLIVQNAIAPTARH